MVHANPHLMPGIMLFACLQGVMLIVVLLRLRSGNRLGHRILAWLVFFFTLHLLYDLLESFGYFVSLNTDLSLLDFVLMMIGLTVAPLIYLYTDIITQKTPKANPVFWLHFSPSVALCICFSLFMLTQAGKTPQTDTPPMFLMLLFAVALLFFLIQIAIYLLLCFIKLHRHKHNIQAFFSATERINLNWLRNILFGFAVFYLLIWFSLLLAVPLDIEKQMDDIMTLAIVALVYLFGYMGIQQADIFGREVEAFTQVPPSAPISLSPISLLSKTSQLSQVSAKTTDIEHTENIAPAEKTDTAAPLPKMSQISSSSSSVDTSSSHIASKSVTQPATKLENQPATKLQNHSTSTSTTQSVNKTSAESQEIQNVDNANNTDKTTTATTTKRETQKETETRQTTTINQPTIDKPTAKSPPPKQTTTVTNEQPEADKTLVIEEAAIATTNTQLSKNTKPTNDVPQKQEKYQKSALDKATSKLLFEELLTYMDNNKPYLQNNISLSELAKQVQLSPNYLSQIINEQSHNNFFDFINRYRVNHVKNLIKEKMKTKQKINMIETALDSGFNSKSAFYNAFKKYEGMTPSQYKKSIS